MAAFDWTGILAATHALIAVVCAVARLIGVGNGD